MATDIYNNNIDPKLLEEDDRIVAYLKGQMSAEEEQQFFSELNDNPALKEKAIATARLVKGLKQVGTEQDKDIEGAFLASSEEEIETAIKQVLQIKEKETSNDEFIERAKRMEKAAIHLASVMGRNVPENADQMEVAAEIIEMFAKDFEQYKLNASIVASVGIPDDNEQQESAAYTFGEPESDISTSHQKEIRTRPIRRVSSWVAVAASLLCIVWLGISYTDYRKTTGLGNQFCDELYSEQGIIRRGPGNPSEADKKLEQLFDDVREKRNLDNAIHELSLCWELSTMETYNDYTEFSTEIGWHLAIAYLKDNNKKEAKKVLEKMLAISEKNSVVSNKAKELIEIL